MFSIRTRQLMKLSVLGCIAAAVTVLAPLVSAHPQNAVTPEAVSDCTTWEALRGECAKSEPVTDDVLDYPDLYTGRVVTLEGRVDRIYSSTVFAMQDNYDLIPHRDRILMISVMPAGAKQTRTTVNAATDENAPVPAVEMVELLQDGFRERKIVRATGTVRMFDRNALEQEFGSIDFGSASLDEFANEPVLLLGAAEFAQYQQQRVEQQAAVIPPPEPALPEEVAPPEPEAVEPVPEPVEPEPALAPQEEVAPAVPEREPLQKPTPAEPEVEPEAEPALPETATPLPLIGLSGLVALMLGAGIRFLRG